MGEGFSWETQDRQRDIAAAKSAWGKAKEMIADEAFDMIILDELNIPLRYETLDINDVVETMTARRAQLHVVITGRNAKVQILDIADLVTEMTMVKHPFREGVKAQKGIEF